MQLPRMTTRRWMIATAVVAVCFAAAIMVQRRRESFRQLATGWTYDEALYGTQLGIILPDPTDQNRARVERTQRRVEYADQLRLKYEHAARYPWLPVEPDRPQPE